MSRYPKKTVNNSTWAVTLFGSWRSERNMRCLENESLELVYLGKTFEVMSDEELIYSMPLFCAKW
jgi:hypothetical protein